MLTQKSLFAYLFIMIFITLIVVVINSQKEDANWLNQVPVEEKELYTLELTVPLGEEDINITKATMFYQKREHYCEAKKDKRATLKCYKRTMPWWSKIYRDKDLQH